MSRKSEELVWWKFEIAVVSEIDHPDGEFSVIEPVTIVQDVTDDLNDVKLAMDRVAALGVCGKIVITLEKEAEAEEEDLSNAVEEPIASVVIPASMTGEVDKVVQLPQQENGPKEKIEKKTESKEQSKPPSGSGGKDDKKKK